MAALMPAIVAGLAIFGGYNYGPSVKRAATVVGVARTIKNTPIDLSTDLTFIGDTVHCEDIHRHEPSGLLFTACEDDPETRKVWFPPLGLLNDPVKASKSRGSIHVINPVDMTEKRLRFENFDSSFVTHGIDVVTDPERPEAVYVFAVNHVPHPEYVAAKVGGGQGDQKITQKAQSQIEIFHHVLGSSTVRHVRSVQHPLIKTPNDIYIKDPHSFYVTNDHYYREGPMRHVEDLWPGTSWTDTIHVRIGKLSVLKPTDEITAEVAYKGLRNNNGLGHYKPGKILIDDCSKGTMHIGQLSQDPKNASISIEDSVELDSFIDNPSYFEDPYRSETQDASGFILPGLARAVDIPKQIGDPSADIASIVWYVKPIKNCKSTNKADCWEKRVLFEDDGRRVRSAAGAVLVAIDPAKENSKRKAWLFVTGFVSSSVAAIKVDL
ncbi:serum paraoxonase arylesterase family protein [Colletotrichum truncatum]|uniref:Serum paraoxonase arylesterase family protein n=1 Tax=Colletotrichum truncatum TaxID=5467 RepID=A0ACC3ZGX4_COLTU|nr:serum paraoxonase arylesterase family protein [Colletotrichum truncatum]KAF6784670.1 serum paraoxonase arylesterase family protein [Colletotrichum truncatum]